MRQHKRSSSFLLLGIALFAALIIAATPWSRLLAADKEPAAKQNAQGQDPFGGEFVGQYENDPFGSSPAKPSGEQPRSRRGEYDGRRMGGEFGGRGGRGGEFGGRAGRGGFDAAQPQTDAHPDSRPTGPPKQTIIWAEPHAKKTDHIRKVLDSPLSSAGLDFADTPLEEVVDFLRAEYQIEIQIDAPALDDLGIGPDEQIAVNLRNISLGSALRIMLQPLELTYVIADELLLITTQEKASCLLCVAVYPVGDLAPDRHRLAELAKVLTATVEAETWREHGAGVAKISLLEPGLLVVSQTQQGHQELVQALTAIRQARQANL